MEEKVLDILRQVMEDDTININSNQRNTDAWDSMHLMLVAELEEAFAISIDPEEIAEMTSVEAILSLIARKA